MKTLLLTFLLAFPALANPTFNALLNANESSLTNGLLVSLPLNEASGNAIDAGTQGWNFTQQGSVGAGSGGTANSRGTYSSANYFDRAETTFNNLNTGDYTVAGWVYLNATSAVQALAGHSPNSGGHGVFIFYADTSGFGAGLPPAFGIRNSTGTDCGNASAGGSTLTTGTWHLLIGTFKNSTREITCQADNGTIGTATATGTLGQPVSGALRVGGLNFPAVPYPLNGYIGKFKIWNRVITTAERTQLWNGGTFSSAP